MSHIYIYIYIYASLNKTCVFQLTVRNAPFCPLPSLLSPPFSTPPQVPALNFLLVVYIMLTLQYLWTFCIPFVFSSITWQYTRWWVPLPCVRSVSTLFHCFSNFIHTCFMSSVNLDVFNHISLPHPPSEMLAELAQEYWLCATVC